MHYEEYANYLARKYNVSRHDRMYVGDCVVYEKATEAERSKMADLWERDYNAGYIND